MKWFSSRRRCLGASALAAGLLGAAGGAGAAPFFQAFPDPVSVGSSFHLVWSDSSAVDPAVGFESFDVRVSFDPVVLSRPTGAAGSAFGNATTTTSYDVFGRGGAADPNLDGVEDPGWARFTITRNGGTQPASFGSDILELKFDVLAMADKGSTDINFFRGDDMATPQPGEYLFSVGPGASVGILATVPEPATAALLLAGCGLLCAQGGRRRGSQPRPVPAAA